MHKNKSILNFEIFNIFLITFNRKAIFYQLKIYICSSWLTLSMNEFYEKSVKEQI